MTVEESGDATAETDADSEVDDSLTDEDLVSQLLTTPEDPTEEEPEETESEEEFESGEAEEPEAIEETEEEEEPEEEPEEGIDFESLAPEQWDQIGKHLNSRSAKRIAGLLRRAKAAEEKLSEQPAEQEVDDPLKEPIESNWFSKFDTMEDLATEAKSITSFIEFGEDLLEDHSASHADDVIHTVGDETFSKREIRQKVREARKRRDEHLPARVKELEQSRLRVERSEAVDESLATAYEWFADDDHETSKAFNSVLAKPAVATAVREFPELKAVIAEGTESYLRKQAAAKKPTKKRVARKQPPRVPTGPSGSTAPPSPQANAKASSRLKRAEESGAPEDYEAYLASTM